MKEIENKIKEIENRIKGIKESNIIYAFMIIIEYIIAFAAPVVIASPAISIMTWITFMAIPNIHFDSIYKNIVERENCEKTIEEYKKIIKEKIKEEKRKEKMKEQKEKAKQMNESSINKESKEYKVFSEFMDQMAKNDFDINKMIDEIVEKMANQNTAKRSAEDIVNDKSKSIDEKIEEIVNAIENEEITKEEAMQAINNKAASAKTKEEKIMWHPDRFQAIIENIEIKGAQKTYKK